MVSAGADRSGSPWLFAAWLEKCCRDASEQLGVDDVTMALYTATQTISLLERAMAQGRRNPGLRLALLQLLQVKAQLIVEVSDEY